MNNDENDSTEKPEIYALKQGKQGWQFSRRNFLAATAVTITALTTGCKVTSELLNKPQTPTATGTSTPQPTASDTTQPTGTPTSTPTTTSTPTQTLTPRPTVDTISCQPVLAHQEAIDSILISPDGSFMVSSADDNIIKLWSLANNQLLGEIHIDGPVLFLAMSPDENELAVGYAQGFIEFYSLPDLSLYRTLDPDSPSSYAAYSPDGKLLAVGRGTNIDLYALPDLEITITLSGHTLPVIEFAFTPDGSMLISGSHDQNLGIWSVNDGQLIRMVEGADNSINTVTVSPNGTRVASHILGEMIYIWSLPEGKLLTTFRGNSGMAFTPDSSILAYNKYDNNIDLRIIDDNINQQTLSGHQEVVGAIAISPDGTLLVSGSEDGAIKMWSLPDGNLVGCAMDLEAMPNTVEGISYEITNETGITVTYTLPCGSPLPEGAVCVCNCVAGSGCSCVGHSTCSCVGHSDCSCVGHSSGGSSHYWYPN